MRDRLIVFFKYGLFWLFYFFVARVLFLIYHYDRTLDLELKDIVLSILHGFRLDLSAMGYFMLIPGLLMVFTIYSRNSILKSTLDTYTAILLAICSFVIVLDLEMYQHWQFRLDATPLLYIGENTPLAIEISTTLLLLVLWLAYALISFLIYQKSVSATIRKLPKATWRSAIALLLVTASMIAPIRGTVGVAPINTGVVYFHPTNIYANHAAINAVWNTGYALSKYERLKYPDNFLDKESTSTFFKKLCSSNGKAKRLIRSDRPNVILIIMESFTFRFIEPLGGIPGIAPNFSKLAREGILFTNMYASGDRTDKGIVSILNGYPAQPVSSIIKYPKKTQTLPYLNKNFSQMGYHTAFTYGGNIDFANFRSYLSNAQFDKITHSGHFSDDLNVSKWGVHDEYVFERFYQEANEAEKPFFKVLLTLSSHEPFEVPMETVFEGNDDRSKFFNSAHYADRALGEFIRKARASEWWDSTLVIITADHGHMIPDNRGVTNPDRFKIPMLWLGGALAVTDTTIQTFTSQTDIANTLLGQLDREDPEFRFSKNVLKEYDDFIIYIYNNGFGFMDSSRHIVYDNTGQQYLIKKVANEKDLKLGKAYMQTLYNDFNRR